MSRVISTISGGKASAWCANWALENYPKEDVVLYFNDTKWEHEDLYRFLKDLEVYFDHTITEDSDGRNPEQLFKDRKLLGNNRAPVCSATLKAKRLQNYFEDGDTLVFGIGPDEAHRAKRLVEVYKEVSRSKKKKCTLRFPLIEENVTPEDVDTFIASTGIEEPLLYRLGFKHNNCAGGCVRAGKIHWKKLLEELPEVYADRERVEREFREDTGKDVHIFREETLEAFRGRVERGDLSKVYFTEEDKKDDETTTECIGICNTKN